MLIRCTPRTSAAWRPDKRSLYATYPRHRGMVQLRPAFPCCECVACQCRQGKNTINSSAKGVSVYMKIVNSCGVRRYAHALGLQFIQRNLQN